METLRRHLWLTDREIAITLAALRCFQLEIQADAEHAHGWPQLTGFKVPSLRDLDRLAEKINERSE